MIRIAQGLLVIAAAGLWVASRMTWVEVRTFDGLGPPRTSGVAGGDWSNALLPIAVLLLAAAVAGLAVRGWLLRGLAILVALVTLALGYLGVSLIVTPDIGARGAELAGVSVISLVGSDRHYGGAIVTLASAAMALLAAVLLMRSAGAGGRAGGRYTTPAARRAAGLDADAGTGVSERGMWDALDEGRDPTEQQGR